jgi:RNA polymerase sigma factor (sigma-70 family)
MDTDATLPARLAADLDAAFPILVEAHRDRLYTIAVRLLGDSRDAEEVAQDALARAYRAIGGYDAERIAALNLRPWLAAIAVNLARNRRRRLDDRQPPVQLEPLLAVGFELPDERAPGPAVVAARREGVEELAAMLLHLSPTIRAAVVLRHVDGLSVGETAEALGRPEGTVKAQVSRGLERLRELLSESGAARVESAPRSPRAGSSCSGGEKPSSSASQSFQGRALAAAEVLP